MTKHPVADVIAVLIAALGAFFIVAGIICYNDGHADAASAICLPGGLLLVCAWAVVAAARFEDDFKL